MVKDEEENPLTEEIDRHREKIEQYV